MDEYIGLVLWHKTYGYCKLSALDMATRKVEVCFCGNEQRAIFAISSFNKDLLRKPLPLECVVRDEARGVGKLIRVPPQGSKEEVFLYLVHFDNTDTTAEVDERHLTPLSSHPTETLLSRIGACDSHALYKVQARYQLLSALEELHNETGGLEALTGARVDLFPHQTFVSGKVINDSVRRFILADEVGLGKTIEAGVVINDILAMKPNARILVLAPGALSRQWLCELHMSFGAQGFILADLRRNRVLGVDKYLKIISSISRAVHLFKEELLKVTDWDLIVVDEAHHILWNPEEYDFVENLSRKATGLLLLSAVPAKEREEELLRLLRLLDPDRYKEGSHIADNFAELYRAQAQIGKGLRILDRDLTDLETGKATVEDLQLPFDRILSAPLVGGDKELRALVENALVLPAAQVLLEVRKVRDLIVERYRLSRRIIKNRRSQLISQEMLSGVSREVELIPYQSDAFESEVWLSIQKLVEQLSMSQAKKSTKQAFFRAIHSAFVDPVSVSQIAESLSDKIDSGYGTGGNTLSMMSIVPSYDEYFDYLDDLASAVTPWVDVQTLNQLNAAINAWIDSTSRKARLEMLFVQLPRLMQTHRKMIVFAGAYGVARTLADELKDRVGEDAVELFTFDLDDAEKEQSVLRFRTKKDCRLLISDETGGEGRNFQFVDAIVHYDLPWSVSALEQRIGRLDRIGREGAVKSYVLYAERSIEEGLVHCLVNGFRLFAESISGLEFMLKDSEAEMIDAAILGDWEVLSALSQGIAEAANRERRTDDAEALTDAGSFPGYARMHYLREVSDALEKKVEDAFVGYFRCIASQGAARQFADDVDPNIHLWRLCPDEVRNETLPGLDKGSDGIFAERRGTFQRKVARERRMLEFFCVGNPLFDAVSSLVSKSISGRVFAIQYQDDSPARVGNYFVVVLRCDLGEEFAVQEVAIQRRLRRYFFGKRLWLVYRLGEDSPVADDLGIDSIFRDSLSGKKNTTDLQRQGLQQLVEETVDDWNDYLVRVLNSAKTEARSVYEQRFGLAHEEFLQELERERGELMRCPASAGRDAEALLRLKRVVCDWQPDVDCLGVLQVVE